MDIHEGENKHNYVNWRQIGVATTRVVVKVNTSSAY